ncbi:hypothetical protein N7513_012705, partial [Penicillium frequentans]
GRIASTFKSVNAATSPVTPTPRFPPPRKHFIATPFYTIEARARLFEGQMLNGAFLRLGSFQRQTLQGRQKLHINDCTLAQSTTVHKSSSTNAKPRAQATPATIDPEPQQPPTAHSPQPHKTITSITSSPQNQQTNYASILQRPITSIPQPTPPVQEPFLPAKPILTIEDLHLRYHNKPSAFQLENTVRQVNAHSNELRTKLHLSHSHCLGS